jgi:hypothetical protein
MTKRDDPRGVWLFDEIHNGMPPMLVAGAEFAADFMLWHCELHRVSLDAFLWKLEAFAPSASEPIWERGMARAVWCELERHRGTVVTRRRLRHAILPWNFERRCLDIATDDTLSVAICHCRHQHPDERIKTVIGEGYVLERRA